MNKEQIQELAMGAALVALGYALWTRFKPAAGAGSKTMAPIFTKAPTLQNPFPYQNEGYDPANPGAFVSLTDLIKGTISDISTGYDNFSYQASGSEILSSIMGDAPTYSQQRGDTGAGSVVRINNGEWWQQ